MAPGKANGKFPLWLHPTGQWTKKIRGRFFYFGTDPDGALKRYVADKDDLEAGRTPRPPVEGVTIADLVNKFLTARRRKVDAGELSSRMWSEYHATCEQVVETFGRGRAVGDLRPDDFGRLRAKAAERLGPFALAKFVQMVRTVFAFGFSSELLAVPIRYGDQFDKPPRRVLRLERQKGEVRVIEPAVVWKLLDAAPVQLRAMILLGLNCGYGQTDCANLQRSDLSARPGWIIYPRQKTGVARRCPLWPETVAALAEVAKVRPVPNDEADAGCVFVTYKGMRWVRFADRGEDKRGVRNDSVGQAFKALVRTAGIPGAGYYWLRHTFRTIADETHDQAAIDRVMGHCDDGMGDAYRERIGDDRLEAVTARVREWLLAGR